MCQEVPMHRLFIKYVAITTVVVVALLLCAGAVQAALSWRGISQLILGYDPEQVCTNGMYFGLAYPRFGGSEEPPDWNLTATDQSHPDREPVAEREGLQLKAEPITIQLEPDENEPSP